MKLLLTCFEAFGGEAENASARCAALLPEQIGRWTLCKRKLPVVFGLAGERCCALLEELRPDAVLMLGQAAGRAAVTPELLARNWRYARLPDNRGSMPLGESIVPGGQDALFATLPVEAMFRGHPGRRPAWRPFLLCWRVRLQRSVLFRAEPPAGNRRPCSLPSRARAADAFPGKQRQGGGGGHSRHMNEK